MYKQTSLKLVKDQSNSQNTLLRLQKSDKVQSKPFISKQQRFSYKPVDIQPGPGAYIDPLARSRQLERQKDDTSKRNQSGNHLDSFVSREHQWIFGSNRLAFMNNGSGLGPGAYNCTEKNIIKISDSWNKSERFNGTQWGHSNNSLGPGSYDARSTNIKPRKIQMGVFKSKAPKTFIDEIEKSIEKNRQSKKNQKSVEIIKQDIEQLKKLVNNQDKQSKKHKLDPVFVSKSKRYELINPENGSIGPGSYNLHSQTTLTNKRKRISSLQNTFKNVRIKDQSLSQNYPGPAEYDVQKFNIEKQVSKKISSLKGNMALETRFKSDWRKNIQAIAMPGPGHYNKQKYLFVNQKQYEHKPLVNHYEKIQVPFLSSSSRVVQEPKASPFGAYNVNQFDLGQKARKKRSHLQKLKAMDISVPGFESSERRTTFNLGKIMKQHFIKLQGQNLTSKRVKSNSSINKDY